MTELKLCDTVVLEEFKNYTTISPTGSQEFVPVMWTSNVDLVNPFKLPCMNLCLIGYIPLDEDSFLCQYKLDCWTYLVEDMNQIVFQVLSKFNPVESTSKLGYVFPLKLLAISNNNSKEDSLGKRIIHYSALFELTANFQGLKASQ